MTNNKINKICSKEYEGIPTMCNKKITMENFCNTYYKSKTFNPLMLLDFSIAELLVLYFKIKNKFNNMHKNKTAE